MKFFRSAWNVFDFVIISIMWIDFAVDINLFLNPMLLRLVRLVRLVRLLRGLSAFEVCDTLQLMVRGIKAAIHVVVWVVVLVFPMMACCALGSNYLLEDFMKDEAILKKTRLDCYEYFGTFSKAMISMFEVTFGNWVPICRFMSSNVDS